MIHIEGMGWLGSMTALALDSRGIAFTWHDTESPVTAWAASTGLVYPCGDRRSMADLETWKDWTTGGPQLPAGAAALCDFTFTTKSAPHNGPKARVTGDGWSVSSVPGVRVDVQRVVESTRLRFADRRLNAAPLGSSGLLIRAHGFTHRIERWVWGWHRQVHLRITDPELARALPGRSAFYARRSYAMAYAYPVVDTPGLYLAGSSMVSQRIPRNLDVEKHWRIWRNRISALAPFLEVEGAGPAVEGWRPQGRPDDTGLPTRSGNVITYPPMSHSGVRLAPSTIQAAMELR